MPNSIQFWKMDQLLVNRWTGVLAFLLMVLLTSCPNAHGSMRGPHHPRNSPKVVNHPGQTHGHNHYVPRAGPGEPAPVLTHDKNLLHDKEHIKEDMGDWVAADGKEMTPEEMEFNYFKMHDFDNNSMLDGLEILQAISHIMPDEENGEGIDLTGPPSAPTKNKVVNEQDRQKQINDDFNYYIELIDRVLEEDDLNKDGYLSYFEYAIGRRREDNREKVLHSSNPADNV